MIEAQGKEIRSLSMIVEKGFAAAKDDFDDLKHELKSDIIRVQEGVGSIEAQLRLGRYEKTPRQARRRSIRQIPPVTLQTDHLRVGSKLSLWLSSALHPPPLRAQLPRQNP